MSRETEKTVRPKRTPIVNRSILGVQGKESGYVYRIVNDSGDRVSQLQERGYEVVTDNKVKVGDRRVAVPTQEGSPIKVSVGGGQQAYVMRIREDWYNEDQAAKQTQINELESNMQKEALQNSDYGKLKIGRE
jgi:hypothetical protein